MKLSADYDECEAYGLCVIAAADLFRLNEENFVEILDETPSEDRRAAAEEAVRNCPMQVLSLTVD